MFIRLLINQRFDEIFFRSIFIATKQFKTILENKLSKIPAKLLLATAKKSLHTITNIVDNFILNNSFAQLFASTNFCSSESLKVLLQIAPAKRELLSSSVSCEYWDPVVQISFLHATALAKIGCNWKNWVNWGGKRSSFAISKSVNRAKICTLILF